MDLPLNAKVYCVDGLCGQSKELVLDRKTEEVTHLVVKGNHLPHAELLVPVELVAETTPRLIRLRCTKDKLAELEPFLKDEMRSSKKRSRSICPIQIRIWCPSRFQKPGGPP